MELKVCEGEEQFSQLITDWCQTEIQRQNASSLFLPAGKTPEHLYAYWESVKPNFLNSIDLLQIDDVVSGVQKKVFHQFFQKHLPSYFSKLVPLESGERIADLAILGLGLNGHVAFHEPGICSLFFSGCISLSDETCHRLSLEKGTWGITYGLGAFLKCKSILLIVKGASKKEVLSHVLNGDQNFPASLLLKHNHLTVIADREALGFD